MTGAACLSRRSSAHGTRTLSAAAATRNAAITPRMKYPSTRVAPATHRSNPLMFSNVPATGNLIAHWSITPAYPADKFRSPWKVI